MWEAGSDASQGVTLKRVVLCLGRHLRSLLSSVGRGQLESQPLRADEASLNRNVVASGGGGGRQRRGPRDGLLGRSGCWKHQNPHQATGSTDRSGALVPRPCPRCGNVVPGMGRGQRGRSTRPSAPARAPQASSGNTSSKMTSLRVLGWRQQSAEAWGDSVGLGAMSSEVTLGDPLACARCRRASGD